MFYPEDRLSTMRGLPILKRWTITSIECYERGCQCDGCPTYKYCSQEHCNFILKLVVIKLVRMLGRPSIDDMSGLEIDDIEVY